MAKAGSKKTDTDQPKQPAPSTGTAVAYEQIAERAYQIYLERGGGEGSEMDDWLQAEHELRGSQQQE